LLGALAQPSVLERRQARADLADMSYTSSVPIGTEAARPAPPYDTIIVNLHWMTDTPPWQDRGPWYTSAMLYRRRAGTWGDVVALDHP
jgi:hypothetical protein